MKNSFYGMAGKAPAVDSVRVVALYEPETGRIAHLHAEITCVGGTRPTDDEIVATAMKSAAKRHDDPRRFGIAMSDDPEHARRRHRIDPVTKSFVAVRKANERG